MSFKCEICGKKPSVANKVSHSNIKTKKLQRPNLHRIHIILANGEKTHIRTCTRCLRSGIVTKTN